jgi:Icc-related predicted phosphoesterase
MRLALISDTHGMLPPLPEAADVIIHAGDIGPDRGVMQWWEKDFAEWSREFPGDIYMTFGNHDFRWPPLSILPGNVEIIVDAQKILWDGTKIWFSPWSPTFGNWAWMADEDTLAAAYAQIPDDTNILVSHSPAYDLLDRVMEGEAVGSKALRDRLNTLPELKALVCGHIHESAGALTWGKGVKILNVASVDEFYAPRENRWIYLEI